MAIAKWVVQTQRKPPDISDIGETASLTLCKLPHPLFEMVMQMVVVLLQDYCKYPEMVMRIVAVDVA